MSSVPPIELVVEPKDDTLALEPLLILNVRFACARAFESCRGKGNELCAGDPGDNADSKLSTDPRFASGIVQVRLKLWPAPPT